MLDQAWKEYRGWATRARDLQSSTKRWNTGALYCVVAAALLGAAAVQMVETFPRLANYLSLMAAAAAALVPFLGKEILSAGAERNSYQARATAEAIKSECYRYAARAGIYGAGDPARTLQKRCAELANEAVKNSLSEASVGPEMDPRCPPDPVDIEWYVSRRIDDQIVFYTTRQRDHERAAFWLRTASLLFSGAAVVFGIIGFSQNEMFAPWIGAMTTIATAVAAQGLLDRRQFLAAQYSAMATALGRIKGFSKTAVLPDLVTETENLLDSEHAAWIAQVNKMLTPPLAAPTGGPIAGSNKEKDAASG